MNFGTLAEVGGILPGLVNSALFQPGWNGTPDPPIPFMAIGTNGQDGPVAENQVVYNRSVPTPPYFTGGCSVATDRAVASPDGFYNAWNLIEDSSNGLHDIWFGLYSAPVDCWQTFSLSAKRRSGTRDLQLYFGENGGGGNYLSINFSLTGAGAVTYLQTQDGVSIDGYAWIWPEGNGWYRVSGTAKFRAGINMIVAAYLLNGATDSYAGDGSSSLYFYGAQWNRGAGFGTFVSTSGVALSGSFGITEQGDTLAAAGAVALTASFATTNAGDTLAAGAALAITGTLAATDAGDTIAAAGALAIGASLAVTEAGDNVAAAATLAITGTLAATDAGDSLASTATLAITGTLGITEGGDTLSAAAALAITGTLAVAEAADALSAAGVLAITGSFALTEAGDSLAASGALALTAAFSITEAGDSLVAAGVVPLTGSFGVTEAGNTLAATGAIALTGSLGMTEAGDSLTAAGTLVAMATYRAAAILLLN